MGGAPRAKSPDSNSIGEAVDGREDLRVREAPTDDGAFGAPPLLE